MGAITSVSCTCNSSSWTQTQLSLCCANDLTSLGACKNPFTTRDLYTSGGKANVTFIQNLPCFSSTWYNTSDGKVTSFNVNNFKNSLLAKETLTYCGKTCFCIVWCAYPFTVTGGFYMSIEPLENYKKRLNLVKYYNNDSKIIPYQFNYKNKYSILTSDYNLINFKKINNYVELKNIESEFFSCSNLTKNIEITLKCPFGPTFSQSVNIFTTIISNMLISLKYTTIQSEYFKRLVIFSRKLLRYVFYYFKSTKNIQNNESLYSYLIQYVNKNNIKNEKDVIEYFTKYIFSIQYIQQDEVSVFFNKYSSIILFIYNIILVNAKNKRIKIDLDYDMCFSRLILKFAKYNKITTCIVNKEFRKICPEILTNNLDNIFDKYIQYILDEQNESYYILVKYVPLFYTFEDIEIEPINKLIEGYTNPTTFENNINQYRQNYNVSQFNTNLTNIDVLPSNLQERIINSFTLQYANRELYKKNKNNGKKCNCGNNKVIIPKK